ncbi:hypothetical protein HDU85_003277 [Gaertneriomyces sp. JEL0708]|nr:hypothetical protein HDU85_003277 [Gaertneriomyces sp. JEL0708]
MKKSEKGHSHPHPAGEYEDGYMRNDPPYPAWFDPQSRPFSHPTHAVTTSQESRLAHRNSQQQPHQTPHAGHTRQREPSAEPDTQLRQASVTSATVADHTPPIPELDPAGQLPHPSSLHATAETVFGRMEEKLGELLPGRIGNRLESAGALREGLGLAEKEVRQEMAKHE